MATQSAGRRPRLWHLEISHYTEKARWAEERLGPHIRHLAFYELINEPAMFGEFAAQSVPWPLGPAEPLVGAYGRAYASLRFGADDPAGAVLAREKIGAALDRLEAELEAGDGEHLVGERFSVADLTAAALFYPLVNPDGGPVPADQPNPPAFDEFRATLSDRPGWAWVEETYRRHRQPAGMSATGV